MKLNLNDQILAVCQICSKPLLSRPDSCQMTEELFVVDSGHTSQV